MKVLKVAFFSLLAPYILFGEETRLSSVFGGLDFGNDSYRLVSLDATIGLNHRWLLLLESSTTRNEGNVVSRSLRLGADYRINEALSVFLKATGRLEPDDVFGIGGSAGGNYALSELWSAKRQTLVRLSYEFISFGKRLSRNNNTQARLFARQHTLGIELLQEITESLSFTALYYEYFYELDPSLLGNNFNRLTNAFPNIAGLITGFAENLFGIEGQWMWAEQWNTQLSLSAGQTRTSDSLTTSLGVATSWLPSLSWMFTLRATGAKAGDGTRDFSLGGEVGFFW